ncbi:MAG: hypothetical protein OSB03_00690 [Vicinamibacterales bacterium]|nr:hypothetical protein [Vicinamibacterales bacterium]
MIDRRFRVIAVPVVALVAMVAAATSVAGQSTPWGDPDLQGTWTSSGATPMERPDQFEGRDKLSDEEVSSIRAQTTARDLELLNAPAQRTEVGTNPGAYNNFWMDRGARTNRTSMLIDPPSGKFPPLTPAGEQHSKNQLKAPGGMEKDDTWEDRHIWERCVTRGGMPNAMFPRSYNNNMQLFQAPGVVVMLIEQVHEVRVVPIDDRPQVSDKITQWNGLSRGHWEGNTLVVETANLEHRVSALQPWSVFSSHTGSGKELTLVERFTRVAPDTLEYEVEVNDPLMYTDSWTVNYPFTQMDDLIYEYACHEGNAGMEGILSGGRAEDLAAGK